MIDCKIDSHRLHRLECAGSTVEIAAEICKIANLIYSATMKSDPDAAQIMRMSIMAGMLPDSATWKPDRDVEGLFVVQEVT